MQFSLKAITNAASKKFNISIISRKRFQKLKREADAHKVLELFKSFPPDHAKLMIQNLEKSKSQIRQDIFALAQNNFKSNGFFVEFGATNGVNLSNTYLMEKEFGWIGILAEPGKNWHNELKQNRSAIVDTRCVWSSSNETLQFQECVDPELSTVLSFTKSDFHKVSRKKRALYDVKTVSLNELLFQHNAPKSIDYLSIDTEGSEFEILNGFDFSKHSFNVITCEHNYSPAREKIFDLLIANGYARKFEHISMFDDWYVKT